MKLQPSFVSDCLLIVLTFICSFNYFENSDFRECNSKIELLLLTFFASSVLFVSSIVLSDLPHCPCMFGVQVS
jgi:hypothetical protein